MIFTKGDTIKVYLDKFPKKTSTKGDTIKVYPDKFPKKTSTKGNI